MNTEETKTEEKKGETHTTVSPNASKSGTPRAHTAPRGDRAVRPRRPRRERQGRGEGRPRSEFEQKIVSLRRVSRVVAGGRRFSFSAALVAGDRAGRVGVGLGKGIDTALAMEKALRDAKKNMIHVPLTKTKSIPHDIEAKFASASISIRPSKARGIVAGSSVRTVLELAGVTDVTAKINSRSRNKLNNARATIAALSSVRP